MRRYLAATAVLLATLFLIVRLVGALSLPLLADPTPWLRQGGPLAGAIGVGLLLVDVVLPVPSSAVMLAHGALFGVALGTLLSLVGSLGAALIGFAIGRRGGSLLARLVPDDERRQVDALLARWGPLAIVATRPVPLLAETAAILAGASPISWRAFSLATLVGSLPAALLYAAAGAAAASFENSLLLLGLAVVLAAAFGLIGHRLAPRATHS